MNHAYCVGVNPGWKKMRFQLILNETFSPSPQPLSHRVKQRQRTKTNKAMFSAPLPLPSLVLHTKFTISELKCK